MDPTDNGVPGYISNLDSNPMLPISYQYSETRIEYQFDQLSPDFDFSSHQFTMPSESGDLVPPAGVGEEGESLYHDGNSLHVPTNVSHEAADSYDDEAVFKFLNQRLMEEEEDVEPNHIMSYDPLAFRVTERSFYDTLGQPYPVSSIKQPLFVDQTNQQQQQQLLYDDQNVESPDSFFPTSGIDVNASSSSGTRSSNSADSQSLSECGEQELSILQTLLPSDGVYQFNAQFDSNLQSSVHMKKSLSPFGNGMSGYFVDQSLAQSTCNGDESVLQFHRGLEEANKFLPKTDLLVDLESSKMSAEVQRHGPNIMTKKEKNEDMNTSNWRRGRRNSLNGSAEKTKSPNRSRGWKNRERENVDSDEGRPSKQSAIYKDVLDEEDELSEYFDKVLLFKSDDNVDVPNVKGKTSMENGQLQCLQASAKKQVTKKETVNLRNLLILCAQAVSTNDIKTSAELLKQIRHHSSPFGYGYQRLAHWFANGLEARMAGIPIRPHVCFHTIASKQTALEKLKIYELRLSISPMKKMSTFFMNRMIMEMAENATTLHIIDFGVMYGYQWPILIHKLSKRPGGPPKLRITGIEVPQAGFHPTKWIEDTGRRLAKYCTRFKVPFEFNAIASQHWESIKVEDLKVERNEMVAVNCMLRFKNLMDETVEEICPRDSVLKLIRSLNPDIFVHSIINGNYNSPFFVHRFREALFYYSTVFESFDFIIPNNSTERFHFETDLYGVEALNVIACEGAARNERPETYKQWEVRTQRAGLKLLPLDPEITKSYRDQFKGRYHKDFKVEQGGDWLLQGWRGRIVYATSCWVPA